MLDDRFWTKVDKNHAGGCWLWTANRNNKGYGLFRPGGSAPKALAHRLSYAEANGFIPAGAIVLHSCDMPSCVNPAHLRIGTYKENVADMDARGRRVTNTPKGESNCNAKMTAEMVTSLRQRYVAGEPLADLIADFGCTKTSLSDYTSGKSWAHILGKNGCPDIDALRLEQKRRRNSAAKITPEIADEIRRRLRRGETGRSIAKRFGVHFATISDIKNGKTWVD